MITIKYTNNIEEGNNSRAGYTYMEQIYTMYAGTYEDLKKYYNGKLVSDDTRLLKIDSTTEQSYLPTKHCYINNDDAFNSIFNIAKTVIMDSDDRISCDKLKNIRDLERNRYDSKSLNVSPYNDLVDKWMQINFYPYDTFDNGDMVFTFLYDCIRIYSIYNIHIWLTKIINGIDRIALNPKQSKELKNLTKALEFINYEEIVNATYSNQFILNLPEEYSPLDDYEIFTFFKFEQMPKPSGEDDKNYQKQLNKNQEQIKVYCESIRRTLIGYVSSIIKHDPTNLFVTRQQPFWEPSTKQYKTIETANSLIGIVYNQLLFSLTTHRIAFGKVICQNPNCVKELDAGNREWCENKECQKARNRIKNYNKYHWLSQPRKG